MTYSTTVEKKDITCFPEYLEGNGVEFPKNLKDDYIKIDGTHSVVFVEQSDEPKEAIKLFKDGFFNESKEFVQQIIEMAFLQHPCLCELKIFSFTRNFNTEGEHLKQSEPLPILATGQYTPFDEFLESVEFTYSFQRFLFIYGYCRAFRFLNSFGHSSDSVHTDHILFYNPSSNLKNFEGSNIDNLFHYPIVSFFCTQEGLDEARSDPESAKATRVQRIASHLSSLCKLIRSKFSNQEIEHFASFLNEIEKENSQCGYSKAVSILENVVSVTFLDEEDNRNIYHHYKSFLDDFESTYFNLKDSDHLSQIQSVIEKNTGQPYRVERQLLQLADEGNPEACLRIAIDYYRGTLLPKNLVLCIHFLFKAILRWDNPMAEILLNSLFTTSLKCKFIAPNENALKKIRGPSDSFNSKHSSMQNKKLQEAIQDYFMNLSTQNLSQYDPVALYHMGAFCEVLLSPEYNTESDTTAQQLYLKAISCYMESLKQTHMKEVMGHLGYLLLQSRQHEYKNKGLALLRKASAMGDVYSTVCLAKSSLDELNIGLSSTQEKMDKIMPLITIYTDLETYGYIDASSTLGYLYNCMYDLISEEIQQPAQQHRKRHRNQADNDPATKCKEYLHKAKEYYTKAWEIYGDELAKEKFNSIRNE